MRKIITFVFFLTVFSFLFLFFIPNNNFTYAACTTTVNNSSDPAKMTTGQDIHINTQIPTDGSWHSVQIKPVNQNGSLGNNIFEKCERSLFLNTSDYDIPYNITTPGDYKIEIETGCQFFDSPECTSEKFTINSPTPAPVGGSPDPNSYDCDNRSSKCNKDQYPTCIKFFANVYPGCPSPNCEMKHLYGVSAADPRDTYSCAYSKVQPSPAYCRPENDKNCTGTTGSQGDCCANLICNAPGANHTALGDGTCVKAPSSLGETCNTCLPTDKWDTTKNSCVDSSGNTTAPVSSVYCNVAIQACTQGQGCIETVILNNDSPAPGPCTPSGNGKCLYLNTGLGTIGTDPQSLVTTLFGVILSISGGIALLLIIISGYRMLSSQGNPEALKGAREQLTAAIVGLLFIIFSFVILQIIGADILHIPSFK